MNPKETKPPLETRPPPPAPVARPARAVHVYRVTLRHMPLPIAQRGSVRSLPRNLEVEAADVDGAFEALCAKYPEHADTFRKGRENITFTEVA